MAEALAEPAWADEGRGEGEGTRFRCVVVSHSTSSSDLVAFNGNGKFSTSSVSANGSFVHWTPVGSPPFPIVASGKWRAKEFLSFQSFGTYGSIEAGILEMMINLLPAGSGKLSAKCRVVCNVGPGALSTGLEEGVTIELPGLEFEPLSPALGLTVFVP